MDDLTQIKPKSILDPPQIKPETADLESKTKNKKIKKTVKKKMSKKRKIIKRFSIGFCIFSTLLLLVTAIPGYKLYREAQSLYAESKKLKDSLNTQNINVVESELNVFEQDLVDFSSAYDNFRWLSPIPYLGTYYKDGENALEAGKYSIITAKLVVETIKPYADIIGFAGNDVSAKSGEETANDRIDFLVQSIEHVLPKIDEISKNAQIAQTHLNKIGPTRYPEEVAGHAVRDNLQLALDMANEGVAFITEGKPLMEAAPYLLGVDGERTYLVLFQNDKELRPTGGFITAYSIMRVNNGKVESVASSDIYNLDSNYTPSIEAPKDLREMLGGPYKLQKEYFLRDMNWNPDFKQSMEIFMSEARKAGISEVDGVVAVDTQVLVYLLDAIGPIGVPGFGNFSTDIDERCDCAQVIYELESFADNEGPVVWSENEPGKVVYAPPNYDNRKKIIGPLMNSVLSNSLGQPKDKLPDLFEAAWRSVVEKHILAYFYNEKAQNGAEGFGLAGVLEDPQNSDYLMVVDANLGGRKSNLYVTQEVSLDVDVQKGEAVKTLTLTYKNPQDYDGWLNSVLPNWTRVYVPQGSKLISLEGFDKEGEVYDESGKTVFSGGFELRPQGIKKIVIEYSTPMAFKDYYNLYIQKQPGTDKPLYAISAGKKTQEYFVKSDKQVKIKL